MRSLTGVLLLTACLVSTIAAPAGDDAAKVEALLEKQRRSSTGVIELDAKTFEDFVVGKSRPYTVIVVADAKNLRNQGKLQLGTLLKEYSLVARTFAATQAGKPAAGKVFFTRVEYTASQGLFGRMGIKSLPFLARISPGVSISKDGAVRLAREDTMETVAYPYTAESIAAFVQESTGLGVGEIKRSSLLHSRLMPLFSLAFIGGAVAIGYQLYYAPFMRWKPLYAAGALVVWWFSTSGGMFNIIRGVPMVGFDHRTRQSMIFMQGSGQLGMEGFIMGTLYSSFALFVSTFIFLLPRIKDASTRRSTAYLLLFLAFLTLRSIIGNHHWKTGLSTHWYLF